MVDQTVTPQLIQQQSTLWQPVIGEEARSLIDEALPESERDSVLHAAISILRRGPSPVAQTNEQTAGLVVGYVQSGKTLSFTTVAALARDNGFRLVIVIAGTSTALLRQSTERLEKDLSVDGIGRNLQWISYTNPKEEDYVDIQQKLEEWDDPLVPEDERPTILITVMKHHSHLSNMTRLLGRLDMREVPTLVIDDEADQASLNTLVNRSEESATYRHIIGLRDAIPTHLFLQYTATPQAPLLINIIDSLSPQFVQVLNPGEAYVGGREFFDQEASVNTYVRVIPENEVPSQENPLDVTPSSLINALRVFLIGVASGINQGHHKVGHRSMLVHPSVRTAQHFEFFVRIREILDEWKRLLRLQDRESDDYIDLEADFRAAYDDLLRTEHDLPPFQDVMMTLQRALRNTNVEQVNAASGTTPEVEWRNAYGWILVGGQAMDRGFTVEGLTVTYMPRGTGVGNADVIQQRGRFFGYKRPYLGLCRIYLEQDVVTAFEQYVDHEEEMRRSLDKFSIEGRPLREWKRAFILSDELRPCRDNVIQYRYARINTSRWFTLEAVNTSDEIAEENRRTILEFKQQHHFVRDSKYPSAQQAQQHLVCEGISLESLLNDLLVPYRVSSPRDTQNITGLYMQLSHALEQNPDEMAVVYQMRPNVDEPSVRTLNSKDRINQVFQGPTNRARGLDGQRYTYPGDRDFHSDDHVSVQIHNFRLRDEDDNTIANDIPVIAVWVPERMNRQWIVQSQPI